MFDVFHQSGDGCPVCNFLLMATPNLKKNVKCFACERPFEAESESPKAPQTLMKTQKLVSNLKNENAEKRFDPFIKTNVLQTRSIEIKIAEDEPSEEKRPRLKVKDDENANESYFCGRCKKLYGSIAHEEWVMCDVCTEWFCAGCVPPGSYDIYHAWKCPTCKGEEFVVPSPRSAVKKKIKKQFGEILLCPHPWCTYFIQIEKVTMSEKKARNMILRHQTACAEHFKNKQRFKIGPKGNKYVTVRNHGLGFGVIKTETPDE